MRRTSSGFNAGYDDVITDLSGQSIVLAGGSGFFGMSMAEGIQRSVATDAALVVDHYFPDLTVVDQIMTTWSVHQIDSFG